MLKQGNLWEIHTYSKQGKKYKVIIWTNKKGLVGKEIFYPVEITP